MTKRKSKTTEFKPPKRTKSSAKRQRSTEETNLQSADETQIQTPNSENNNSHNASCSEKLDEHQPEQITLQISQTTEFPVDPCCSLEEKTCNDDNDEDGNAPIPPEIEQTAEISVQTPEHINSEKYTPSQPLNVEVTKEDQPDVELDNEKSEITSNSNHESQKIPDDCDSELPSDECKAERELSHTDSLATEPKTSERLRSSDIIDETSVDETGIQMTEDADPLVKRKTRKRMGMCRLGDRKKMLKEQPASGNVSGEGPENEASQDINEESVMISGDLQKDGSISGSSFPTSCPVEDVPDLEKQEEPDVQNGNEVQILAECMSSEQEITHETYSTLPSHANSDDPLEDVETERVERSNNERNIREDKIEMCDDVTTEIGTEATVDLAEACKESTDVSAVMEGPLEVLKATNEGSASSEVDNHFEELVGGNEVEECCQSELDLNTSISGQTNEPHVELTVNETFSVLPVIDEIKDESESLDCTLVSASVTAEDTENCENRDLWSLSAPAAPPCGEDKDVQSVSEHDGLPSETHEPDPSSPLSIHSVTDSQLNNIPLSLEDFPIIEDTCDLEDATDLVCGLIRDLTSLNRIVRDAHRNIGLLQPGRKPPRPQFRSIYGPQH